MQKTSFGRQILQVKPPGGKVFLKRLSYLACALAWAGVFVFLLINPFADSRGVGNIIGMILMVPLTALCLWATFRRDYEAKLTLYETGFTIAIPGSAIETFDFRDFVGTRCVRKGLILTSNSRAIDTTLAHNNPTVEKLNASVLYISSDTFQRRQKLEGNVLRRANQKWSQLVDVAVELNTEEEVPIWDLSESIGEEYIEQFFTALDKAFSAYLLKDIHIENLNRVSLSFGEELALDQGQFIFTPAMRTRRKNQDKQQKTALAIPLERVWSIQAPRPEKITETSMLKLMGAPGPDGQAEELVLMFLNLALNIDVLYAIANMNREHQKEYETNR